MESERGMKLKAVSGIMLTLLLTSMLTLTFDVQWVKTEDILSEESNTKDVTDAVDVAEKASLWDSFDYDGDGARRSGNWKTSDCESGFLKSEIQGLPVESFDLGYLIKTISVETHLSDCSFYKIGIYDYVKVKGFETYTEPGKPQLPVKTFVLTLPKSSKVLQVEVERREVIEIGKELYIVPTPQPVRWTVSHERNISGRERFEPDESVYSLDTYFPSKAFSYDEGCDNENKQVFVRFFPIQYTPKTKKVYLIAKAEITIRYQVGSSSRLQSRDNTENVTRVYPVGVENIIITPPSLFQQAETLKNFHNSEGLVSEVVNTTWIYWNYANASDPPYDGYFNSTLPGWGNITGYNYSLAKRIISFLNDSSEHPHLRFVTLFGNARLVPPSYYLYIEHFDTYNNWIPADFFYGSPDYDLVPNYKIGRIPVNSTEEAEHVVSKIESWNSSISYDWFRNVVLGGGMPFGTIYYYGEMITTDSVNRESFTGMNITKRFHTGGDFDPEHLMDAFSGDTGMLYIITHGSGYGIYPDGQALVVDDLLALPSNSRVPVVVSIACEDGAFDTNVLYGGFNVSFGEGVLLSNASGIAYIGGSRVNYGAPYFYLDDGEVHITKEPYMAGMLTYVFEAYHNGTNTLGGIMEAAMEKYISVNVGDIIDNVTLFEFCLLGDPALQLPPQQPGDVYRKPDLTAFNPEGYNSADMPWYLNDTTITISSETDSPNITVRRLEVFDDQTFDLLDADTVSGWFNYTFEAEVGTYLVKSVARDCKEGWIYLGVVPPLTGAQALVVDDDQGDNYEEYYQNAVSSCGYTYDTWMADMVGTPNSSLLSQYPSVIWLTGDSFWDTLSFEDRENLEEYLDGGGCLFISGQGIGYNIGYTSFYEDYLHANYIRDYTGIYTLEGVSGDPIGDGIDIEISGGDGANNQWFPSEIEPADIYAHPVFEYTGDGYGAIHADTGSYKVVYFAFGFEAISTFLDRNMVMERILNFFQPAEHDLAVSLETPFWLAPGDSALLNATVYNRGLNNETNVELRLLINGSLVSNKTIPELLVGSCVPFSYLWIPTVEATYNVTGYVLSVLGENNTLNNRASNDVIVSLNPIHFGDLVIYDDQTFAIEDVTFTQIGNVYIRDNALLIIRNAELRLNQTSYRQYVIQVEDSGRIETENATITSHYDFSIYLYQNAVANLSSTSIKHAFYSYPIGYLNLYYSSFTSISNSTFRSLHSSGGSTNFIYGSTIEWLGAYGGSTVFIYDSTIRWDIYLSDSSFVSVSNSTIGYSGLSFRKSQNANLYDLYPGFHNYWNIYANASVEGIGYNLTLWNTEITWGWSLSCYDSSNVSVYDSMVHYLYAGWNNPTVSIYNSTIERLSTGSFSTSSLHNSIINYLDAWNFMGALYFDGTVLRYSWHIHNSRFFINGNVSFEEGFYIDLSNSNVTRNYNVICLYDEGYPVAGAELKLYDQNDTLIWTSNADNDGQINFNLTFTDNNYTTINKLKASGGGSSATVDVKMLSDTPIILILPDVIPPTVSIASPKTGAIITSTNLTVEWTGFDNETGINYYLVYLDEELLANTTETSCNLTALTEGFPPHTLVLVAYDKAGNLASEHVCFIVDATAPNIEIIFPKDGYNTKETNLTIVWWGSDAETRIAYYLVFLDNTQVLNTTSASHELTGLTEGNHRIKIEAYDLAGNTDNDEITITLDNTMPIASMNAPANDSYLKDVVIVNITGYDVNLDKIELYISGELKQMWNTSGFQTYSWNTLTYVDGLFSVKLIVYDKAGNLNSASINVIVDNTAPTIVLISPENDAIIAGNITVDFYILDSNLLNVVYAINEEILADITGKTSFIVDTNTLNDGTNEINIAATDKSGNSAFKTLTIVIDNINPSVSVRVHAQTVPEKTSVSFDASNSSDNVGIIDYEWDFGDGNKGRGITTSHIYANAGTYTVTLTVKDAAGNSATDTLKITVLLDTDGDGTPDTTDPDDDNDGMPDTWETENGLNPLDAADASLDPDGDGLTNLQEYGGDTNPNVSDAEVVPLWILGVTAAVVIGIAVAATFLWRRRK